MTKEIYDRIATYYDLLHASLTEDIDYILSLARQRKFAGMNLRHNPEMAAPSRELFTRESVYMVAG